MYSQSGDSLSLGITLLSCMIKRSQDLTFVWVFVSNFQSYKMVINLHVHVQFVWGFSLYLGFSLNIRKSIQNGLLWARTFLRLWIVASDFWFSLGCERCCYALLGENQLEWNSGPYGSLAIMYLGTHFGLQRHWKF